MNRITKLAAGLAIAALGSGCLPLRYYPVEPGDPLDARLSLTWTIGGAVTCASIGVDTVRVASNNLETGEVFTDLFVCTAGGGTTAPLDAGDYDVTAELADCRGSASCPSPYVYASESLGVVSLWSDGVTDLGPVVFHPAIPTATP